MQIAEGGPTNNLLGYSMFQILGATCRYFLFHAVYYTHFRIPWWQPPGLCQKHRKVTVAPRNMEGAWKTVGINASDGLPCAFTCVGRADDNQWCTAFEICRLDGAGIMKKKLSGKPLTTSHGKLGLRIYHLGAYGLFAKLTRCG